MSTRSSRWTGTTRLAKFAASRRAGRCARGTSPAPCHVLAIGRPSGVSSFASRELGGVQSSARGALPLGLGRQLFTCPGGVREGVDVRHVYDRMIIEPANGGVRAGGMSSVGALHERPPVADVAQVDRTWRLRVGVVLRRCEHEVRCSARAAGQSDLARPRSHGGKVSYAGALPDGPCADPTGARNPQPAGGRCVARLFGLVRAWVLLSVRSRRYRRQPAPPPQRRSRGPGRRDRAD